jgi:peptidoglycan/xylan/chitin deacetylase (PgdA/CDA1 family)
MIKNDQMLSETQTMTGTKTVGKGSYDNSAVNENTTIEENTEEQVVEQTTVTPETKTTTTKFPKHDYSVAMESQLPQYSDEIAKKVVDVYFEETKKVYLTFDDGPSVCTDDILDILDQYNVKATFFVLGSNVELYPGLVKRAYDSGHFIANHGYSHRYSQIYTSAQTVLDEYNQTVDAIRKAIGVDNYNPHLFRFPGGSSGGTYESIKREAIEVLKQNQITYTNWNCLTGDSAGSKTVEDMWNELNETSAGDDNLVILMHDAGDKQTTIEFLPQLIEYYQNQGYEFVNYYDVMCN